MSELRLDEVIDLLERALRAEITLDELPALWPPVPEGGEFAEVREDLEFALEHLPVHRAGPRKGWFGRRRGSWEPDLRLWRDAVEYHDLQLHLSRLREARNRK